MFQGCSVEPTCPCPPRVQVRPVPAVPITDPANYNHQAKAFAESLDNGAHRVFRAMSATVPPPVHAMLRGCDRVLLRSVAAVWTNQFDNTANRAAHAATTGPEIWEQTAGTVSAFTCATGTGGTLAGELTVDS